MTGKSKRILSRILAVVLAVTLVPSNMWGTMNVVRAEEETEVFAETDTEVSTEDVQEEVEEKETFVDVNEAGDSVSADVEEAAEDDKDAEVKEDKPVKETTAKDIDNKVDGTKYEHCYTGADGKYTATSDFFTTASSSTTRGGTITYNGAELSQGTKLTTSAGITFKAPSGSELTLVYLLDKDDGGVKIDGTEKSVAKGTDAYVLTVVLDTGGEHTILKGTKDPYVYYISVTVPAGSSQETVATPTADPADEAVVKIGETIKLKCDTQEATIYYTINGEEKTYSNDGILVEDGMQDSDNKITITAYAKKDGCTDSDKATFTYTLSMEKGENQLETPTAKPDAGEVPRGTEVTLKGEDGASIYYTIDGTTPSEDSTLFEEAKPIIIDKETTIKAVAIQDGKDNSLVASFTYTIKKPTITVHDDSKSIISEVALDGDITFSNGEEEVFDISLKAEKNTDPDDAVKTAAENAKEDDGTIILYYDFSLVNNESSSDTVSIEERSEGTLEIKMPYTIASDVNKRNRITVVNADGEIETTRDSNGFGFGVKSVGLYAVVINPPKEGALEITEEGGYEEGAYAEWKAVDGADGYMAYVASAGGKYERIDDELIREYKDYWRVDTVGLAKGTYYIKVDAVVLGKDGDKDTATVISSNTTDALKVINYDRSGFAFSKNSEYKTGSGAYNDDGTLREDAIVFYVTAETAKTMTWDVQVDNKGKTETRTGIQDIINGKQKGYDTTPWAFRIIGCVTDKDLDRMDSSAEGLQIKGNGDYSEMNITIEGIGEDAAVKGFGFLIRGCGNVEFRNFGILDFMDDGVSIDTNNCNLWIHDLDLFYGQAGSAADQKKGDGTVDIKLSQYCTVSYNHFWDSGKSCLIDASEKSSGYADYLTYHHNWFDHSDSRHPRIRNGKNFHIYNNYYDGNSKYGVGATTGSSAFVEANYFRKCKYPMLISLQGSDILEGKGTFSSESGGMIKAYGNHIEGAKSYLPYSSTATVEFDAYEVDDAGVQVPSTVKTKSGSYTYNNFDTANTMYDYVADTPEDAKEKIERYAGRVNGGDLKWTFDNEKEDANDTVIPELKKLVENYESSVKSIGSGVPEDVEVLQGGSTDTAPPASEIAAPTASPVPGIVEKGTEVTLSHESGADIYYTIDGEKPTEASIKYAGKIKIDVTTTIRAIAVKDGKKSDVVAFRYTVLSEGSGGDPNPGPGGDDQNTTIKTYEFNPQKEKLTVGKMPAVDTKYGTENYFTIGNANDKGEIKELSTTGKTTTLSGSFKSDLKEYSIRYQFGAPTDKDDPKAIRFHNNNKANVYVVAYRTGDTDYNLYLDTVGNVKELTRTITEYTFNDVEKGDHSICATGNIGILYVIVEEFVPKEESGDQEETGGTDESSGTPESSEDGSTSNSDKEGIYIEGLKPSYEYTGDKITPAFNVVNYDISGGTVLTLGVDYTVTYKNNKDAGEATVIVKGKGNYASEKGNEVSKTFMIVKPEEIDGNKIADDKLISVKGAKVKVDEKSFSYDGTPQYPKEIVLTKGSDETYTYEYDKENKKYVIVGGGDMNVYISISNNVNKGNATILVTGAPGSNGKPTEAKAKFKIMAAKLDNTNTAITQQGKEVGSISAVYSPQGAVPKSLVVTYNNHPLIYGKDYVLKYSGNKKAGTAIGTVTVTGKGGYTGKATTKFDIDKAPMTDFKVAGATAHDGIKTVGKIKATVVRKDDGSELKAKQYQLEYYRKDTDTEQIDPSAPLADLFGENEPKELWVRAVAVDADNLVTDTDTNVGTEKIKVTVGTDISKANFKFVKGFSMPYTGNAVTLTDKDIDDGKVFESVTIKGGTNPLARGTDYEIVSYTNNINKGTATAVIAGKGAYGGTKTIKFKIGQQLITKDATKFDVNTFFNKMNSLLNSLFN